MKLRLLLLIVSAALLAFSGGYVHSKNVSTETLEITQTDEKIILDYLDNQTNDLASPHRGRMYSAFNLLGTRRNKIYLWVTKIEYLQAGGKITHEGGDAVSSHVVLYVKKTGKNFRILSHKFPDDGENYFKSLKKLFPPDIQSPNYDDNLKLKEITRTRAEEDFNPS